MPVYIHIQMCLCFSVRAFGRTTFTELLVHTYSNAFMLFRMNFKFKLLVCHFLHAFLRKLGMILVSLVTVQYTQRRLEARPGMLCTQLYIINFRAASLVLDHSIGMNRRATQLKFWCPRMSYYASHYHYGSQSIAFSGQ